MELNEAQRRAVSYTGGNLQLVACAGSGKTEVVARRVAFLLSPSGGLKPRNIIAFTFTEKAAGELKQRISERTREALGDVRGLAEMYVGTIHAFALDLLKAEVPDSLKYEVLNEVQQALFVDRHSRASGLTAATDLRGQRLRRYVDTDNYIAALNILREDEPFADRLAGCSIPAGLTAYERLLDEKGYLDYSGILANALQQITSNAGLRDRLSERLREVIVDEYQDVNPIQEKIIGQLNALGARLCVVGDDDQTVYQWRGSRALDILQFSTRYAPVERIKLQENYRSSQAIVEIARAFIRQNTVRLEKEMEPASAQRYEDGDVVALQFDDSAEEARYIAERILELRGIAFSDNGSVRGLSWSDVAILLRSVKANGEPIAAALRAAGIPYIVVGMNNLFRTAEAEAARQLFYFFAKREGVDENTVLSAWLAAATGSTEEELRYAISEAARARTALGESGVSQRKVYNLQRQFLLFLENAAIREERAPQGSVVFYNLGKFSQVISDFESIHFKSSPAEKYDAFAGFLEYRAEASYPEGWQDSGYANPDAVRIMTVHQAKGMQWPAVFVPALLRNRFPSKRQGGRTVWHLLPAAAIPDQARYEGTVEDERRLFYVALTRSQKYLYLTAAPQRDNALYRRVSEFLDYARSSTFVKRFARDYLALRPRSPPQARDAIANVVLSFSDIKYFFECPYQFKLRILYGFNAPLDEAIGYGKSLHDALAEVHARSSRGEPVSPDLASELIGRHLHVPYAYDSLKETLSGAAERVVRAYIQDNTALLPQVEFFEKPVELDLGNGVTVIGRMDLVRRVDTGETTIVDLKSKERVQAEEITEAQLHTYALGYKELTGRSAEFVELYDLDARRPLRRPIDEPFLAEVRDRIEQTAQSLRRNDMPPRAERSRCSACDYVKMCSPGSDAVETNRGPD